MRTRRLLLALLCVLAMVVVVPVSASATSTLFISNETTSTGVAGSTQAQTLQTAWTTAVSAAHPGAVFEASKITSAADPFPSTPFFTASDGTSVSVQTRLFLETSLGIPTYQGTLTGATQGATSCSGSGAEGQDGSPRPTSYRTTAGCPTTGPGFAFTQNPTTTFAGQRSGLVFTFSKPTAAFGAWFNDVETKTTGLGKAALVRTYTAGGALIASSVIGPGATNEAVCGLGPNGNNTAVACGNSTTRWLGFSNSGVDLVSTMIVIVGDDDIGTTNGVNNDGREEGLGFIGATLATYPEIGVASRLASVTNLGTGQYDVTYAIAVTNSGGKTLSALSLVDNLASTFPAPAISSTITAVTTSITAVPTHGSTVALNPTPFNGGTVTELLKTSTSTLTAGDSFQINLTYRVTPGASLGPFNNSVTARGTNITTVSDLSVDSPTLTPDADGNGTPNNDTSPTPVTFTEAPQIGLAKYVTGVVDNLDGTQRVTYGIVVKNSGDVLLHGVQITDDLGPAFAAQLNSVGAPTVSPSGSMIVPNPSFNGVANKIVATGSLAAGASATLEFTAIVSPATAGPFNNSARVTALSPAAASVADDSQNGTDPDPDANGTPSNNSDLTPVVFVPTGRIAVSKTVTGAPAAGVSGDFGFDIQCVSGATTVSLGATVTLTNATSGSRTVTGVPAGYNCTVTESTVPTAPAGYVWNSSTGSPSVVVVSNGQTKTVAVTNSLRKLEGSITIGTTVTNGPAGGISGGFTYSVNCGVAFTATATVTLASASIGSTTVSNIPDGGSCTVTQTAVPTAPTFFAWAASTGSPTTVTVHDGVTSSVPTANALRVVAGDLTITKTVTGAAAGGFSGTFGFSANCGAAGTFTTTIVFSNATTNSSTIGAIPAPSSCVVTETSVPSAPPFYVWSGATGSPSVPTVVTDGGTSTVSVTNSLRQVLGSLTINKVVDGSPSGGVTADFHFGVDCGVSGSFAPTISIVGSTTGSVTINGIPAPASCTVTETSSSTASPFYVWDSVTGSPVTVSISDGTTASTTVHNGLRQLLGNLQIIKSVAGAPVAGVSGDFDFTVDCGAAGTFASTVTLLNATSGSSTISGIPAPASCTVTETPVPAAPTFYAWAGSTGTPTTIAIHDGVTTPIAVINTVRALTGDLTIVKTVTGGPAGGISGTFGFSANCGAAGTFATSISFSNSMTGTATISAIPAPSSCTVTETSVPAAPTFYSWDGVTGSPSIPAAIVDGGSATVPVTNALRPLLGNLTIRKQIDNAPGGGVTADFNFSVDCGASGTFAPVISVVAGTVGAVTINGIPAPANCTVTETSSSAAPPFYLWDGVNGSPATVAISDNATSATTVRNALRQSLGSLQITKIVDDAPSGGITGTFGFSVDCGAAGTFTRTITLLNSTTGNATVSGIPAPAICTVNETVTPAPPTGYFWAGPFVVDPALPTVVDGATTAVSVTTALTRQLSALALTVHVMHAPAGGLSDEFVFLVDCGASGTFTLTVPFAGTAASTAVLPNIAAPTVCVLTELSRPDPPQGFIWDGPQLLTLSLPITTDPIVAAVTVVPLQSLRTLAFSGYDPVAPLSTAVIFLGFGSVLFLRGRRRAGTLVDRP